MYAIISEGGRQFKVEEGQELDIDYRDLPAGDQVKFDRVLAYRDDETIEGRPAACWKGPASPAKCFPSRRARNW